MERNGGMKRCGDDEVEWLVGIEDEKGKSRIHHKGSVETSHTPEVAWIRDHTRSGVE